MTKESDQMRPRGLAAHRTGVFALVLAAIFLAFTPLAGADGDQPAVSNISITQTELADQPGCLPGVLALTNKVTNTSEYFELLVRASAPPCSPIEATAVIYAMPGNGVAWPQRLVEFQRFTISKAGTTVIRFTKTCDPVQFDVVTGAVPEVISPEGPWHGPMLFPFDLDTALQHWGCTGTTTTTTSTTTTTEPSTTTTTTTASTTTTTEPTTSSTTPPTTESTVPSEVAPTTEVRPTGSTQPAAPTSVLGTQENRGPAHGNEAQGATTEVKGDRLARTGSDSGPMALIGVVLATSGAVLILISRRRGTPA